MAGSIIVAGARAMAARGTKAAAVKKMQGPSPVILRAAQQRAANEQTSTGFLAYAKKEQEIIQDLARQKAQVQARLNREFSSLGQRASTQENITESTTIMNVAPNVPSPGNSQESAFMKQLMQQGREFSATATAAMKNQSAALALGTAGAAGAVGGSMARGAKNAFYRPPSETLENSGAGTWLIILLTLAALDIFGGKIGLQTPYAGFSFAFGSITTYQILGVFTSVFFAALLISRFVWGVFDHKILLFPFFFYLGLKYFENSKGTSFFLQDLSPYLGALSIVLLLVVAMRNKGGDNVKLFNGEDISFLAYAFVLSILLSNVWGWYLQRDFLPLIHLFVVLAFCYTFVSYQEQDDNSKIYIYAALLLFFDFVGTSAYSSYKLIEYFPILLIIGTSYIFAKTRNKWAGITLLLIFITSLMLMSSQAKAQDIGQTIILGTKQAADTGETRIQKFGNLFANFFKTRIEYATQFSGQVEQNQYESLGVYFSDLKAAQPRFYTDEPIIIWGGIRSKTYQDAIAVTTSCYKKKDEKTKEVGTMKPDKPFLVFQLDETDIECQFKPNPFPAGTHSITLAAEYNFITNAYQKVYFMDKDRYRNYIRENLDPLTEFGIKDKNPATVFTNGPVEIGMKIDPLISIDPLNDYPVPPAIYITLTNRKEIADKDKKIISRWEGKIKDIRELVILTPPGVTIPKPEDCQPLKFVQLSEDTCKKSCTEGENSVYQNCAKTCEANTNSKETCLNTQCRESAQKCSDDCYYMFRGDGADTSQKYDAYALDISSIPQSYSSYAKDIDKFKTFSCRIQPTTAVLNTAAPLTTSYFRVRARYNYLLENSVPVTIEQSPTQTPSRVSIPVLIRTTATGSYDAAMEGKPESLNDAGSSAGLKELEYSHIVLDAAKSKNVDYFLLKSIIQQENPSWSAILETPYGIDEYRIGLMQVSIKNAKEANCIDPSTTLSDARILLQDPRKNIECAAAYIGKLIDAQASPAIKPGIQTVMAGYYNGQGAMAYSSEIGKSNLALWENTALMEYSNTRSYVAKVTQYYNTLTQKANLQATASATVQNEKVTDSSIVVFSAKADGNLVTLSWGIPVAKEKEMGITSYYINRYKNNVYESNVCQTQALSKGVYPSCTDQTGLLSGSIYTYKFFASDFSGTDVISKESTVTIS